MSLTLPPDGKPGGGHWDGQEVLGRPEERCRGSRGETAKQPHSKRKEKVSMQEVRKRENLTQISFIPQAIYRACASEAGR